ncbi:hypothetical protein GXB59_24215 [Escherichia coli]|nr:hypothetical protein [Escherichia coli]
MLPSETMIWQPEFTDKTLSRKPGAVQTTTRALWRQDLAQSVQINKCTDDFPGHQRTIEAISSGYGHSV